MSLSKKFTLPGNQQKEQHHFTEEDQQRPSRMMETPRSNFRYMKARGEKDSDQQEKSDNTTLSAHPVNKVGKS